MIVVDTSALARIFLAEPDFERYRQRLIESNAALVPAPCYLEFTLLKQLGSDRRAWIDGLVNDGSISLVAFGPEHGPIAADAASTYGKGSGHPARLNFGDCMTYAIAKHRGLPLLYVGRDFHLTDLRSALEPE